RARSLAACDRHILLRHPVIVREEFDQRGVGPAFLRRRREADLEALAVLPGELAPLRPRLDVQVQDDLHQRLARTMRTIWMRTSNTSGVRSTLPSGGMKRRSGRRKGAVIALNTGAIGA